MLAALLAIGLFDLQSTTEEGAIVAAEPAIVVFPALQPLNQINDLLPLGAPEWLRPLDPSDRVPYAVDFSQLLDGGVEIAEIVRITMSAAGAAVGVTIDEDAPRRPVLDEETKRRVQVWLSVLPGSQSHAAFQAAGVKVGVSFLIRTDDAVAEDYERTAVLVVRQL